MSWLRKRKRCFSSKKEKSWDPTPAASDVGDDEDELPDADLHPIRYLNRSLSVQRTRAQTEHHDSNPYISALTEYPEVIPDISAQTEHNYNYSNLYISALTESPEVIPDISAQTEHHHSNPYISALTESPEVFPDISTQTEHPKVNPDIYAQTQYPQRIDYSRIYQGPAPRNKYELIMMVRDFKPFPEGFEFKLLPEENNLNEYIEEAMKGEDMDPTWKQKIFSQREEDDDPDLKFEIADIMRWKNYHPLIAEHYRIKERYCILERREYCKDIEATKGFDVGYYPYLNSRAGSLFSRYYYPPDVNLPPKYVKRLYGMVQKAIELYNSVKRTNYSVVNVIKAMTSAAAGTWFYITFEATNPLYGNQLWTFECKIFKSVLDPEEETEENFKVSLVRLKDGAGPSSWVQGLL